MAIELYTGFVGSGKSYAAVKNGVQIADAVLGKRFVVANFPVTEKKTLFSRFRKVKTKPTRWIYKNNQELTVQFLVDKSLEMGWDKKEGSCLVIFDEASIPFNSRTWNRPDRMEWIEFLTESRKFGYDVIFITQDTGLLDKQIRKLCEYEVQYKKLNNMIYFKWLSLFRITLFGGISYWNGIRGSKGQLKLYFYNKAVAERYDTLKKFNTSRVSSNEQEAKA